VFKSREELLGRIDDPDLDVDADTVLVLQNAGPRGAPGMPEWGQLPAVGIGMGLPGYQTPAETPDRVEPQTLPAAARLITAAVRHLLG
jgi:hypothetical protein